MSYQYRTGKTFQPGQTFTRTSSILNQEFVDVVRVQSIGKRGYVTFERQRIVDGQIKRSETATRKPWRFHVEILGYELQAS